MGRIRRLDDALIDQIAAGEVVERPSSVVKELVENALDAGAARLGVEIVEGGRARIRVVDDGRGMDPEDAAACVRRHATSKLRAFGDLDRISTMGFRGEALPSIASVSRFRLLTRPRDAIAGTEVRVIGGGAPQLREAGAAPGTVVEVDDLFFNVPARRKFLKARQTETGHVRETCVRVALARPDVHVTLRVDGRESRSFVPAGSRLARAQAVFPDLALSAIEGTRGSLRVEAALAPVRQARRGMRYLLLFVNGRPVTDRHLARAAAQAYGERLEGGRYPTGVLWLELPGHEVDVNAHPRKSEVRFANAQAVRDGVLRVLASGLGTRRWGEGIVGSAARAEAGASDGGETLRRDPGWLDRRPGSLAGRGAAETVTRFAAAPAEETGALAAALRAPAPPAPGPAPDDTPLRDDTPVSEPGSAAGGEGSAGGPEERLQAKHEGRAGTQALAPPSAEPAREAGAPRALALSGDRAWLVVEAGDALLVVSVAEATRAAARRDLAAGTPERRRLLFPARLERATGALEAREAELAALGLELSALGEGTLAVHTVPGLAGFAEVPPEALAAAALDAAPGAAREALAALAQAPDARMPGAVLDALGLQDDALRSVALTLPRAQLGRGLGRTYEP
ncbi:MAG: DNA mismatch repair endonuclease MutL [Myxococcota bacterium]